MKYIIAESKMVNMVEQIIKMTYPDFANGECNIDRFHKHTISYYGDGLYASYDVWSEELTLRRDLYDLLVGLLGEENLSYVLEWFNKKYGKEAITIESF